MPVVQSSSRNRLSETSTRVARSIGSATQSMSGCSIGARSSISIRPKTGSSARERRAHEKEEPMPAGVTKMAGIMAASWEDRYLYPPVRDRHVDRPHPEKRSELETEQLNVPRVHLVLVIRHCPSPA